MKILHVLDHYKPHFSGYVFRTSYILRYQRKLGLEPVVITSPKHGIASEPIEKIDNTLVYRTLQNGFGNIPFIRETRLMNSLQKRIEEVIREQRPDIIHAHSPSLNGIPAVRAGKMFGIPVVYEVRALWEDAAVDHGTFHESSLKYRISKFMETNLFKQADAIFTICEGLKNEIVSRGLPDKKITIIPNCVDTGLFCSCNYDEEIANGYNLQGKKVFGFIGSFYNYEGIDLLIDAYQKIFQQKNDVKLILVGDGPEKNALFTKVVHLGLQDHVIFTGKVPHEQIKRFYSIIDVLVYPRKSIRLTELVTPLKPLEAMAMGKIVVGSDVGGIRELVTHNKDGFLFKAEDVGELAKLLNELTVNKENLDKVSIAAIDKVTKKHKWELSVKNYLPVYERLIRAENTQRTKLA